MKVFGSVLENRIRCPVSIDNMKFGFMPGKGTTDAIFIMRQVQEKHQAKKKTLSYSFTSKNFIEKLQQKQQDNIVITVVLQME